MKCLDELLKINNSEGILIPIFNITEYVFPPTPPPTPPPQLPQPQPQPSIRKRRRVTKELMINTDKLEILNRDKAQYEKRKLKIEQERIKRENQNKLLYGASKMLDNLLCLETIPFYMIADD
jgi:hypothetical protein